MRLSEKENWKSFTAVEPMVLLKRATAMRLGWLQVSESRDVPESAPQPELPVAGGAKGVLFLADLYNNIQARGRVNSPFLTSSLEVFGSLKELLELVSPAQVVS